MNPEILKGQVRTFLGFVGGILVALGFLRKWFSPDQITGFFGSEVVIGAVAYVVSAVWSGLAHTQSNAVAIVKDMAKDPETPVKGVLIEPSPAGDALIKSVGSDHVVVSSGTAAAKALAA